MIARRALRLLGYLVGGALTVTGCVSPAPVPERAAVTNAAVTLRPTLEPAPRPDEIVPPPRIAAVPDTAPQDQTPELPILSGIDQLVGMEARAVAKLFGQPSLRRDEPPAQVWLYTGGACTLHLFLYADARAGIYRVKHSEVRGRDLEGGAAPTRCFDAVVTEAASRTH